MSDKPAYPRAAEGQRQVFRLGYARLAVRRKADELHFPRLRRVAPAGGWGGSGMYRNPLRVSADGVARFVHAHVHIAFHRHTVHIKRVRRAFTRQLYRGDADVGPVGGR